MAFGDVRRQHSAAVNDSNIVVDLQSDLDFRSREYARLFAGSDATPFQHPLWLDRFYSVLAPHRDAEKIVVTGHDAGSGELRLVLPLIRRQKSGVTLLESTDLGVSDYAAPVLQRGWRPDRQVARAIAAALPAHDLLRIRPIRAEAAGIWRALLDGDLVDLDFGAHAVSLPASHAEWRRTALEPGFARYVERKRKRFFKESGAALKLLTDAREIADAIERLRSRRAGRFEGDPIQQAEVVQFYAAVAAEGETEGMSRTYALMLGDEPVAHIFGIAGNGRFHYLLIGCDYERHGRLSPGIVAYDLIIEDWIEAGGTTFDFTIGDEPFKRDFGTQRTAMLMLIATPTWRGRLARAAYNAREQLRQLQIGGRRPNAGTRDGGDNDAA